MHAEDTTAGISAPTTGASAPTTGASAPVAPVAAAGGGSVSNGNF
jgi:hypothetical protein